MEPVKIRFVNKRKHPFVCAGIVFVPAPEGATVALFPDQLEKIENNQSVQFWRKKGWFKILGEAPEVVEEAPAPEPGVATETDMSSLKGMKLPEAKAAVAECTDTERLLEWFQTDNRSGVHKAIEARMEELAGSVATETMETDPQE